MTGARATPCKGAVPFSVNHRLSPPTQSFRSDKTQESLIEGVDGYIPRDTCMTFAFWVCGCGLVNETSKVFGALCWSTSGLSHLEA